MVVRDSAGAGNEIVAPGAPEPPPARPSGQLADAVTETPMLPFLSDRIFRIGAAVVILGSAPLLSIIFLSKIGLWPDPNPNPVGPGLLVFVTFWPGVILMAAGIFRSLLRRPGNGGE